MTNGILFDPDIDVFVEDVHALNGNVAAIAKKYNVSRRTVLRFADRHPEVNDALYEAREAMLDMAESSLYRRVLAGESWAVCFFLKTQGRKRGYIERGETFNLNVNLDKLTIEQLERLAAGEHPSLVLGQASGSGGSRGQTIDAPAIASASSLGLEEEAEPGSRDE